MSRNMYFCDNTGCQHIKYYFEDDKNNILLNSLNDNSYNYYLSFIDITIISSLIIPSIYHLRHHFSNKIHKLFVNFFPKSNKKEISIIIPEYVSILEEINGKKLNEFTDELDLNNLDLDKEQDKELDEYDFVQNSDLG